MKNNAMKTVEKINQSIQNLPEDFQKEVLDFIEFLINKTTSKSVIRDNSEWNTFSLASAMRDLNDGDFPVYKESDLKERWKFHLKG